MGPDPQKVSQKFDSSDYVINNQLDDEMDIEENQMNDGYFMLNDPDQQHYIPANDDDTSEEDEDEENEYSFPDNPQQQQESPINAPNLPPIRSSSSELVSSVWKNCTSSSNNIEISSEKSEQITEIMSKITLPNAPDWLNEINPENILDQIRSKNRGSGSDVNKN